ncbi:MAG: hypothetical protein K2X82_07145 [Gemmataceae bacterium]|nr:hypothetical protein [Gemmataceae bacterium]
MAPTGTLAAALDALPLWWPDATDAAAFDAAFTGWARACGWRAAGFVWPVESNPTVVKTFPAAGVEPVPPAEVAAIAGRLRAGEPTVLVNGTRNRVYALVAPRGLPAGLLWAEKLPTDGWADADRAYLALAAQTVARSPALAAVAGPVVDPDALSRRLADAAVIAGRMAHDFDNILTGILGFADLTLPTIPADSPQASFVAEIIKVGQRGTAFTQQLHQFNRGGQARPDPGSVAATLGREETRLRPAMPAGLKVEKDLPADLPAVAVEANLLQAALGHLFENAVEACSAGGTVRLAARPVELSAADAAAYLGPVAAGPHILVTITDNGSGIKPEARRRLFAEPFFTTKVRHRGLGLAVAYRVLAAHRGGVRLDPAPPPAAGTVARVVLPVAAPRPAVAPTTSPTGLASDTGRAAVTTVRG